MDFRSFPKDRHGFDEALVIVDRLTKRPVSIPCHKTIDAKETARLFINHVYRWVGLPESIVSDRGPQFVSTFWKEFCEILGFQRSLSTAHHAQTDGQTEIVNQYIAQRLRPFINHYQDNWSELLSIVDFAAATLPHASIGMSPFMVERGYEPRTSFDWNPPSVPRDELPQTTEAEQWISTLHDAWETARTNMQRAQEQQKTQADKHRRDETFEVDEWVMVTTKNWNLGQPNAKLSNQAGGPFQIAKKVGQAYKLRLPPQIKVHPIFAP
jgi:transposase InsO family protein